MPTKLTIRAPGEGIFLDAELLRELGIEGETEVEVEVRCEGRRLVVEVARGVRLERLSAELERLMLAQAEFLPQLR